MRFSGGVGLLLLIAGCSGSAGAPDAAQPDAAIDDASLDDATTPDDVAADGFADVLERPIIAAPTLTPCPAGWREIDSAGVTVCEPWPASGHAICPDDQAHFPGTAGCVKLGPACPSGDYASDLPTGVPIGYVKPATGNRGDGSLASPYTNLARALAQAAPGTVLALAQTTFEEDVVIDRDVTLWGACAGGTVLLPAPGLAGLQTIGITDANVRLRNLSIRHPDGTAILHTRGSLELANAYVQGTNPTNNAGAGVTVRDADLTLRDVRIFGASVTLKAVVTSILSVHVVNVDRAVLERGDSILDVEASNLRDVHATGEINANGQVNLFRSVVDERGWINVGPAPALLEDVVVRPDAPYRFPVDLRDGSVIQAIAGPLELRRVRVSAQQGSAIGLFQRGTLTASDLVVHGASTPPPGIGVVVSGGSRATLQRASIRGARLAGMAGFGTGSTVTASDVVVSGTREPFCVSTTCASLAGSGLGLGIYDGAAMTVTRFVLEGHQLGGIQLGPGAAADLMSGEIRGNPIGANVQASGFSLARLTNQVYFSGNGLNFDSVALPIPPAPSVVDP